MNAPRTGRAPRAGAPASLARLAAAALAAAAAACASTSSGVPLTMTALSAEAPAEKDRSTFTGELVANVSGGARGAAYGPFRVYGSAVDLTYVGGNAWEGTVGAQHARLTVSPGSIRGAGIDLYLAQEGQAVTIRGTFAQRQISLSISPDTLHGKMAMNGPGLDLKRVAPNEWSGSWGTSAREITLKMNGEAARHPAVLTPQFYLALLGVLL